MGGSPVIFGIAFLVAIFLLVRRDYLRLVILAISLVSGVYSSLLKLIFKESRPVSYISNGLIPWDRLVKSEAYSFPSTHTVLYTVFFGYLFYLSFKLKGVDKVVRHSARLFCALMIISVGISRVLLGAHFVKDVVSGYLFGLLYLGAVIYIDRLMYRRKDFGDKNEQKNR